VSRPKDLVVKEENKYHFFGRYHGCEIQLDKKSGEDWYILVWGKDGTLAYDGWWPHSSNASVDEALTEAFDGAQL
jgi:hypothetical protein